MEQVAWARSEVRGADIWWFDAKATRLAASDLSYLDPAERARAAGLVFPSDRHRYCVAHVMLRALLADRLGVPAGQLRLSRLRCPVCGGPEGKPVLATVPELHFSLAHSGDAVAIAIAAVPVGVDVERPSRTCLCELLDAMPAPHAAAVRALPPAARHTAILRWWVRVEARLKCTGQGIRHGFGDCIGHNPATMAALTSAAGGADWAGAGDSAGDWQPRDLSAPGGYVAAVAFGA